MHGEKLQKHIILTIQTPISGLYIGRGMQAISDAYAIPNAPEIGKKLSCAIFAIYMIHPFYKQGKPFDKKLPGIFQR